MVDIKTSVQNAGNQVAETSKQLVEGARDTANKVVERSKDAIDVVSKGASNAATYLEQQGERATDAMSGGLKATARTIRDQVPQEGVVKEAAYGVAQQLSNAASYLDEQGLEGIFQDLLTIVKRNPVATICMGIGAGFLLGLASRTRD